MTKRSQAPDKNAKQIEKQIEEAQAAWRSLATIQRDLENLQEQLADFLSEPTRNFSLAHGTGGDMERGVWKCLLLLHQAWAVLEQAETEGENEAYRLKSGAPEPTEDDRETKLARIINTLDFHMPDFEMFLASKR